VAIRKHTLGKRSNKAEQQLVKRAFKEADLILTYGKRAIVALAGRGVDPQAAARILATSLREEGDFYRRSSKPSVYIRERIDIGQLQNLFKSRWRR